MVRPIADRHECARGVTLPELLVVITIIGLAVAVAIPVMTETIRSAKVRAAANSFAVSLKAARMLAVTTHRPVDVRVFDTSGANAYEYEGRHGRLLRFEMPSGVRIASSTSPIIFQPNGGVTGGANTTIEVDLKPSLREIWRIETSNLGMANVIREEAP